MKPTSRASRASLYNGHNNGYLAMPARTLAERLHVSKTTAARALIELEELGFIEAVKVGSFRRRDRMASEYRLTFQRCDASGAPRFSEAWTAMSRYQIRQFRSRGWDRDSLNGADGFMGGTVSAVWAFPTVPWMGHI